MQQCHYALVDTHASHQAACQWEFDVCNTHAGVLNKMLNMFAGGFVICGIVFHELFSMLTMEYPVVLPNTTPFQAEPIPLARLWVLCTFLFSHLLLVVLCCTACMVRVYGFGNDFWSVVESIIAAFLILVMPQNIHARGQKLSMLTPLIRTQDIDDKALPYIKSRVLARARGGRRRLVFAKIKKSVNMIKAANMFKISNAKPARRHGISKRTYDGARAGQRKRFVSADVSRSSAGLPFACVGPSVPLQTTASAADSGDHTRISRRVRRASIGAIEQSNAELLSQAAREHNAVLSASSAGSTTHNNQRCSAATAEKPPCETAPCCEGQQTEKDEQIRLACKDDTCSDARCDKLQGQEEDEEDEYIPVTALTPEARYETGRRLSACTERVT